MSLPYIFYLRSHISCYWDFHTKKLSLKRSSLEQNKSKSQFASAITPSQKLGSVWEESLWLLFVLLEVKSDVTVVIPRQLPVRFLQPVYVFQSYSRQASIGLAHWGLCDPCHFFDLHSRCDLVDLSIPRYLALRIWCSHFPLTYLHHCDFFFGTSFPSGTSRCSKLICCIYCPSPWISHFLSIPRRTGSFYWRIWVHSITSGCKVWQIVFFI